MNTVALYEKAGRQALEPLEQDLLKQEIAKYPYFPLLHAIAALQAEKQQAANAQQLISLAALYHHDRKLLAYALQNKTPLDIVEMTAAYRPTPGQ